MHNETNCLESRRALIKTNNNMKDGFDGGSPLYTLTVGEFIELLDQRFGKAVKSGASNKDAATGTGRQVFGLKGIQELFGVSHKTAQRLKDHDIKQAVIQNGRMIVVDVDKAMRLFNKKRAR